MNTCQSINRVIKLSEAEGNTILCTSSSDKMKTVIWMNNELSSDLRYKIQLEMKELKYDKTKDLPHDPASEYFVCDACKTVIVFPVKEAN